MLYVLSFAFENARVILSGPEGFDLDAVFTAHAAARKELRDASVDAEPCAAIVGGGVTDGEPFEVKCDRSSMLCRDCYESYAAINAPFSNTLVAELGEKHGFSADLTGQCVEWTCNQNPQGHTRI